MFPEWLTIAKDYSLSQPVPLIKVSFQQVFLSIIENALYAIESKPAKHDEFIRIKSFSKPDQKTVAGLPFLKLLTQVPLFL